MAIQPNSEGIGAVKGCYYMEDDSPAGDQGKYHLYILFLVSSFCIYCLLEATKKVRKENFFLGLRIEYYML